MGDIQGHDKMIFFSVSPFLLSENAPTLSTQWLVRKKGSLSRSGAREKSLISQLADDLNKNVIIIMLAHIDGH